MNPVDIISYSYLSIDYQMRSKVGEITGTKIYSICGEDTWHGDPESAIKVHLRLLRARKSGYFKCKPPLVSR